MNTHELVWRKSTRSSATDYCVETANIPGGMAVRDSQNPADPLSFPAAAWTAFVAGIKDGEFDLQA